MGRCPDQRVPIFRPCHAGGSSEARPFGLGGRFGLVQESPGNVRRPEVGAEVPTGLKDVYWPCCTAALQGILLQGKTMIYANFTQVSKFKLG